MENCWRAVSESPAALPSFLGLLLHPHLLLHSDTTAEQPVDSDTTAEQPVHSDTTAEQPVHSDTTAEQLVDSDTTAEQLVDRVSASSRPWQIMLKVLFHSLILYCVCSTVRRCWLWGRGGAVW